MNQSLQDSLNRKITYLRVSITDRCNRVRLTVDGKLYPCLYGDTAIDFREVLRRGCEEREIERLFDQAMGIKPAGHELTQGDYYKILPDMVHIGG